jgi:hypothetical protein
VKTGRKTLKDEIKIVERLAALSEPTFRYIRGMLDSEEKADKKWAVEQMIKLYSKCIPTEITGAGGEALFPKPLLNALHDNISNEEDTQAQETN